MVNHELREETLVVLPKRLETQRFNIRNVNWALVAQANLSAQHAGRCYAGCTQTNTQVNIGVVTQDLFGE